MDKFDFPNEQGMKKLKSEFANISTLGSTLGIKFVMENVKVIQLTIIFGIIKNQKNWKR